MNKTQDALVTTALQRILATTRAQWWPGAVQTPKPRHLARLSDTLWTSHGAARRQETQRTATWRRAA